MSAKVAAALAVLALAAPGQVAAQIRTDQIYMLRIEGFVGAKPAGLRPLVSWVVRHQRTRYDLHVTRLQVLSGNTAYFNIITFLRPYTPAFRLAGDSKALAAFADVPPNQPIVMIGSMRFSRSISVFMLGTVEPLAQPSPAAG